MGKYYALATTPEQPNSAVAVAYTIGEPPISYELIPMLEGKSKLPFDLILKKVKEGKNGLIVSDNLKGVTPIWEDFQPNCLAWPLMSQKMREIVETNLMGNEEVDWIEVEIKTSTEQKRYNIMRFNKMLDVIDYGKTIFVTGTHLIIKPYFLLEKISKLSVFPLPEPNGFWKIPSGLYISHQLKDALETAKVTGVSFEEVSMDRIIE